VRILLIGYSRIAKRRVIPAMRAAAPGAALSIASRSAPEPDRSGDFTWFRDYQDAIERSGAHVAYISLTNEAHAEWVARALSAGLHVIVDKPACIDVADTAKIIELAREKRRLIAEATVFAFHPQYDTLTTILSQHNAGSRQATAVFSFPALPESDFRNRPEFGGGALWDVGPYAVGADRVVFGEPPEAVYAATVSRDGNGLLTRFSILFSHGAKGSLIGHFGFGTEYQNFLSVSAPRLAVSLRRAFTTTVQNAAVIDVQSQAASRAVEVPAADSFELFIRAVFQAIDEGQAGEFLGAISRDAELLDRLRRALADG
jgi:dTDP-3,4-didehydro-2,6-dideoxy-alpha-D-glucose 3-reductase